RNVTGVQTCALPIYLRHHFTGRPVNDFHVALEPLRRLLLKLLQPHLAEADDVADGIVQVVTRFCDSQADLRIRRGVAVRGLLSEIGRASCRERVEEW